jgi:signal transduction histidine kinase/sensor domain CHASE-containing protein
MKIRQKVILLLVALFTVFAAAQFIVQQRVVLPSFAQLERDAARKDMDRVANFMARELDVFLAMAADWGDWDATYQYMLDHDPKFLASSMTTSTIQGYRANAVAFVDLSGRFVWATAIELDSGTPIDLDVIRRGELPSDPVWRDALRTGTRMTGLLRTSRGAMLTALAPVLNGAHQGPIRGMVLLGRLLTEAEISRIAQQTQVPLRAWVVAPGAAATPEGWSNRSAADDGSLVVRDNVTEVTRVLADVSRRPLLALRLEVPRVISARGQQAVAYSSCFLIGAGIIVLVIVIVLLNRTVLSPLTRMTNHAIAIGRYADLTTRLDLGRSDELGDLAQEFDRMVDYLAGARRQLLERSLERERLQATERERLEGLVAARTQDVEQDLEMFKLIAESTGATPFKLDLNRRQLQYVSSHIDLNQSISLSRWAEEGPLEALCPGATNGELRRRLDDCAPGRFEFEGPLCRPDETAPILLRIVGTCEATAQDRYLLGLVQDVTALRRDERERSAAQKLESVGRLAAGIAHEINTPLQYVNDNVRFLQSSFENLGVVLVNYRNLGAAVESGADVAVAAQVARVSAESVDLDFLMENTTPAVSEALSGLDRITAIVRSMKEFAHPDGAQKAIADLNQAIKNTLVIAHSEYKYAADVEEQFGAIPQVRCHLGQINQVVLNLIINAAHAIAEAQTVRQSRGTLTVRTRQVADYVEIAIGDNGGGIPEAARDKLFDPFFTTKAIGVGTGQGLAIARDIVVNKHGGTLSFESQLGQGTTFFIRLPINPPVEAAAAIERAA